MLARMQLFISSVQVKVEASWDSTVHDCPLLSRAISANQRVYLTVRTVVLLSHPAHMQLILRKRICVNVSGRQVSDQEALWVSVTGRADRKVTLADMLTHPVIRMLLVFVSLSHTLVR